MTPQHHLSLFTATDSQHHADRSVCVVGLGYIGLPTAAILANRGCNVTGVDIREDAVARINAGEPHIHEPHLGELVHRVVRSGKLRAQMHPCTADVFMICVPTPFRSDRSPDLSYVEAAAAAIRPHVKPGAIVILESTSPPGTTRDVVVPAAIPPGLTVGKNVFVAYCPERVLPGRILQECVENDRIVGGVTPACQRAVVDFYRTFVRGTVYATTAATAEMTKLAENAFRDVNIAFANELSVLASHLGVDPFEVISLANRHPRVNILNPGPGVGGHCISVDPWFLVHAAPALTPLIRTAREVNDAKPHHVVAEVAAVADVFASAHRRRPLIGCLGLAYKPDIDDLRESPSVEIVRELAARDIGLVAACDPFVKDPAAAPVPLYELRQLLAAADILVLLTDHEPFRTLTAGDLRGKFVVDPRGAWREILREPTLAVPRAA